MATAKKIADHRSAVDDLYLKSEAVESSNGVMQHATIAGADVLPLAFFKHSQSRKTLDRVAEAGEHSGRHNARSDKINKRGRTIFQHWDEHARQSAQDPSATFNASIEPKRLKFVEQAIEHYGGDLPG